MPWTRARVGDLGPVGAVPFPRVVHATAGGLASEQHHALPTWIERHHMLGASGRTGVVQLGPFVAVPRPGVAGGYASREPSAEEDRPGMLVVVRHRVAGPCTRTDVLALRPEHL